MLKHCTYDKVKLLKELSSIVWFIEKHAKQDAKDAGDTSCHELFEKLGRDLNSYIDELHKSL